MTPTQLLKKPATDTMADLTGCNSYIIDAIRDENGQATTLALARFVSAYRRGDFMVGEQESLELEQMDVVAQEIAQSEGTVIPSWGQVGRALFQVISSTH